MFHKPNEIPGFLNITGFVDEEPKYDDKQRPFTFTTNLHENSFNWQNVYNWDPVSIKEEHDVEKMQDILNQFVKCNFTSADLQIIQNPLIFRLLQVLQIVVEYIAHSQAEVQTLYGKTVHENTTLKSSLSRYKVKNNRLISVLRNMKKVEKCPICFSYFDSDISLDRHIHKHHFKVYDLWTHVRENKEFSPQEEVKKLNWQIDAMRILLEQQNQNKAPHVKEKNKTQTEEEELKESTEQLNVFELSGSSESENKSNSSKKSYKYIIDPDYQPFHKAVHHDDGPYLVFQEMVDYVVSVEPQSIKEERAKKCIDSKYYKKAKLFLQNSPQKGTANQSPKNIIQETNQCKSNIKLDYNEIDDPNREKNGQKIKIDVHDQALEVKMSYMEKGPKWRLRKRVEKELKDHVPDVVPKSTIHQLFEKLNFFNDKHNDNSEKSENLSLIEEEEEEEEEEEIELTSACYSSLQCSSDNAQYYSHDGGGTTRYQQFRPSLYNPGGRRFPTGEDVHQANKNPDKKINNDDDVFQSSSDHEQKNKKEHEKELNKKKPETKQNEKNPKKEPTKKKSEKENDSLSSIFSSQNSPPPAKPSVEIKKQPELLSEGSFSSSFDEFHQSKSTTTNTNDHLVTSSNKNDVNAKKTKSHKSSTAQDLIEEEEEVLDFEDRIQKSKKKTKGFDSENSFDMPNEAPKSTHGSHRRKKFHSQSKSLTNELTTSQPNSQSPSKKLKASSTTNLPDKKDAKDEDDDEDVPVGMFSRSQIHKSKKLADKIGSQTSLNKDEEAPKSAPSSHRRKKLRKHDKSSTNELTASQQSSQKSSQNIKTNSSTNLQDQIEGEIEEEEEVLDDDNLNKSQKRKSKKVKDDFDSENTFDMPKSVSGSNRKKKGKNSKLTQSQKSAKEETKVKNDYEFDSISWDN